MDKKHTFVIFGGKKLSGSIPVRGAKNSALKVFAASLLTDRPVTIKNVPEVEDISRTVELLKHLGCSIQHPRSGTYTISARNILATDIQPEIAKKLRASIVFTGPLLTRFGKTSFPHPGGCVIGKRPIDVFLDGYRAFGARIGARNSTRYSIRANRLIGMRYFFHTISVTGTETLMMAATLAKGTTTLVNCACEPEIPALAEFLNKCGARIHGAGTPVVTIRGVRKMGGGTRTIIPDRIETGTFAILAAATKSRITITNCIPEHVESLLWMLQKMGMRYTHTRNTLTVYPGKKELISVDVKTHEYPGFPTDMQAPFCSLLTQTFGSGKVHETIYEGRLNWTEDLKRMGANVQMFDPHRIEIHGPTKLHGREIVSPDIRAGMAFIIAALCARGKTVIHNAYQIDRGYEEIEKRLRAVGANISRRPDRKKTI